MNKVVEKKPKTWVQTKAVAMVGGPAEFWKIGRPLDRLNAAVEIMHELGGPRATPTKKEMVFKKAYAAECLIDIQRYTGEKWDLTYAGEDGVPYLTKLLTDPQADIRETARVTLRQIGEETNDPAVKKKIANALVKRDQARGPIEQLCHEDAIVRLNAACQIRNMEYTEAAEPLIKALAVETDHGVRIAMCQALGKIELYGRDVQLTIKIIDALINELGGNKPAREIAMKELVKIARCGPTLTYMPKVDAEPVTITEPKIRLLIKALGNVDALAQYDIFYVLGDIGERAVIPLIEALKDENPQVRYVACCVLGTKTDPDALKPLIDMLYDPDKKVHETAHRLLQDATGRYNTTTDPALKNEIRKALEDY